jgi:putative endonuclease
MQHDGIVVFFEVRYRADNQYLHALETIDARKCSRIIKTSLHFLQKHNALSKKLCRFDVIVICGAVDQPEIRWIKNAFQA